jgi:hypothetical protein
MQLLLGGLLEQQHVIGHIVAQVFCEVMTFNLFCAAKLALDEGARTVACQVLRLICAQQRSTALVARDWSARTIAHVRVELARRDIESTVWTLERSPGTVLGVSV